MEYVMIINRSDGYFVKNPTKESCPCAIVGGDGRFGVVPASIHKNLIPPNTKLRADAQQNKLQRVNKSEKCKKKTQEIERSLSSEEAGTK